MRAGRAGEPPSAILSGTLIDVAAQGPNQTAAPVVDPSSSGIRESLGASTPRGSATGAASISAMAAVPPAQAPKATAGDSPQEPGLPAAAAPGSAPATLPLSEAVESPAPPEPGARDAAAPAALPPEGAAPQPAMAPAAPLAGDAAPAEASAPTPEATPEAGAPDAPTRDARAPRESRPTTIPEKNAPEEQLQPWGTRAFDAASAEAVKAVAAARRVEARGDAQGPLPGESAGPADAVEAGTAVPAPPTAGKGAAGPQAASTQTVDLRLSEADEAMPGLVLEHARLASHGTERELRVRLRPPELGEIRLAFQAQGDGLKGSINVEREEVREWLTTQVPAWREELAGAGLKLERLDVNLLPRGGQDGQALPSDRGAGGRWTAGRAAQAPAAPSERTDAPVLGRNQAAASGRLDYWA